VPYVSHGAYSSAQVLATQAGSVLVTHEVSFTALAPAQQFEELLLCCVTDVFLSYPALAALRPRLLSLKLSSRAVQSLAPPPPGTSALPTAGCGYRVATV
jgi:hypothetical protein